MKHILLGLCIGMIFLSTQVNCVLGSVLEHKVQRNETKKTVDDEQGMLWKFETDG